MRIYVKEMQAFLTEMTNITSEGLMYLMPKSFTSDHIYIYTEASQNNNNKNVKKTDTHAFIISSTQIYGLV